MTVNAESTFRTLCGYTRPLWNMFAWLSTACEKTGKAASRIKNKAKNQSHVVDTRAGPSLNSTWKPKEVETASNGMKRQPDQETAGRI